MNGVHVVRMGTSAVVEHDCAPRLSIRIELGSLAHTLSDHEILERHRQAVLELGAALVDSPQLRWDELHERWRPCGRALVLVIEANPEPIAMIDDVELTLPELARVCTGHGAHICLVFLDE